MASCLCSFLLLIVTEDQYSKYNRTFERNTEATTTRMKEQEVRKLGKGKNGITVFGNVDGQFIFWNVREIREWQCTANVRTVCYRNDLSKPRNEDEYVLLLQSRSGRSVATSEQRSRGRQRVGRRRGRLQRRLRRRLGLGQGGWRRRERGLRGATRQHQNRYGFNFLISDLRNR